MVMYLVRTVWELIRLKSDTGPPARIHEEMLRVLAVFLEGFEMMVTGAESNEAHTLSLPDASLPSGALREGSAMSSESWKLLLFADPVTCKNLKLAVRL